MSQPLASASLIVSRAWLVFRSNFRAYAELGAWILAFSLAQWAVFTFAQAFIPDLILRLIIAFLLLIPLWLVMSALKIAVIEVSADALSGNEPGIRRSLLSAAHKLLPFIFVSVLQTLVFIGGALAFVVPLLLFLVWFRFSPYAAVIEGRRGVEALAASRQDTKGRFWPTFWRIAVIGIVFQLLIPLALFLVIGLLFGSPLLFLRDTGSPFTFAQSFAAAAASGAAAAIGLPLVSLSDLLLWSNLRQTAKSVA